MDSLAQIYARHSGPGRFNDKGSVHSYIDIYEELLAPYRATANRFLEIGVFDGWSIKMFEAYFLNAEVHGIDCSDQPHGGLADLRPMIESRMHHIHIFDATDEAAAEKNVGALTFDVIIDDAAHNIEQQMKLIDVWMPRLSPGGLYIVEDIAECDRDRKKFEDRGFKVLDRRFIRGRFDDVLAIFGGVK